MTFKLPQHNDDPTSMMDNDFSHWPVSRCLLANGRVGVVVVVLFAIAAAPASGQGLTSSEGVQLNDGVPKEVQDVTVVQRLGESVPRTISLTDSLGRKIKTASLFDGTRPVLFTLNYSDCPMLCNVQLNNLAQGLRELNLQIGKDFRLVSVSIDPKETTQKVRETKQMYMDQVSNQPGAKDDWLFCTASQASITQLADSLGFSYTRDAVTGQYYHPAMLAFVSPDGVITRYSLDVAFPADQLKLSILDAGQGTVGSPVDQFILWCFSYDSDRNSYVLGAWRLMRLGGLVTVAIILATLLPFWIGRKRNLTTEVDGALEAQTSPGDSGTTPAEI